MDDWQGQDVILSHVMLANDKIIAYSDRNDAYDNINGINISELSAGTQSEILDKIKEQLSDDNRQITVHVDTANVPEWAINALINGDHQGLSEKETKMVNDFYNQYPDHIFSPRHEDTFFDNHPAFGEPTNTISVDIVRIATPAMLRQEVLAEKQTQTADQQSTDIYADKKISQQATVEPSQNDQTVGQTPSQTDVPSVDVPQQQPSQQTIQQSQTNDGTNNDEKPLTEAEIREWAEREGLPMPNMKFVENRFAKQLEENDMLIDFREKQKMTWDDHLEFVRKLCNQIEMSPIYQEYMASEDDSYDADREVWRKIYKTLVQDNTELESVLEEKSLYWNDDKEVVDTFVLKTIKRFDEKNGAAQELLPEFKDLEDKEFARKLFRSTILNADTYQRYMSETSRHWDFSRLAYMDVVIMQIAIAEMMTFPNIPVSVTINEYVELAKVYSTYKSSGYINGMLDAIARHLIHEGLLLKTMGTKQGGGDNDSNNNQQ